MTDDGLYSFCSVLSRSRGELHQIPQIAVEIAEDGDRAVIVGGGRADPLDPGGGEARMIAGEIIGGEEQEHAPARLIADEARLFGRGGAGEEDRRGILRSTGRADGDPSFVLRGLVTVLDQREAELADIEGERLVIVADDQGDVGDVGEMGHR